MRAAFTKAHEDDSDTRRSPPEGNAGKAVRPPVDRHRQQAPPSVSRGKGLGAFDKEFSTRDFWAFGVLIVEDITKENADGLLSFSNCNGLIHMRRDSQRDRVGAQLCEFADLNRSI